MSGGRQGALAAMSISFLLGSGFSRKAGMPTVVDLTEAVLAGEVWRHTDSNYYPGANPNPDIPDFDTPRVVQFIDLLKQEIDSYYQGTPKGTTNYEDLYYLADQIRGSEGGWRDNPAIGALIEKLRPQVAHLLAGTADFRPAAWDLLKLADETCNYIRDVVWRSITGRAIGDLSYFQVLADAARDNEEVDIFTLNHDTLTEGFLASEGIAFTDGFREPTNEVRYWEDGKLENDQEHHVRVIKLHGSVNWFEFLQGDQWRTGIPSHWDVWHTKGPTGELQIPNGGRPHFLAGTGNKPLEYQVGMYVELHHLFHQWLRLGRRLAVIGYGFGDAGINQRTFEWLLNNEDARMVVVHPDPDGLKRDARWNLRTFWDELEKAGRVAFIRKRAEDLDWQELKKLLNDLP